MAVLPAWNKKFKERGIFDFFDGITSSDCETKVSKMVKDTFCGQTCSQEGTRASDIFVLMAQINQQLPSKMASCLVEEAFSLVVPGSVKYQACLGDE